MKYESIRYKNSKYKPAHKIAVPLPSQIIITPTNAPITSDPQIVHFNAQLPSGTTSVLNVSSTTIAVVLVLVVDVVVVELPSRKSVVNIQSSVPLK